MGNDAARPEQANPPDSAFRKPASIEEFEHDVQRLNTLASNVKSRDGQIFVFEVGERGQVMWRSSVTVKVSMNPPDIKHPFEKTLNYKQFYNFYHRMFQYVDSATTHTTDAIQSSPTLARKRIEKKSEEDDDLECAICMDRAAEVALAECNHAFCTRCLDEWTKRNPTCPMCRSHTSADSEPWILTSAPESDEIFTHLKEFLHTISSPSS